MSQVMRKTLRVLLSLILVVVFTTSCTGSTTPKTADTTAPSGPQQVVINHLTVRNTGCTQNVKELAAKYAETHPGFVYNQEVITDRPAAMQKVKTLVASNSLPEWFEIDPTAYCQELIKAGMLVNQGELLDRLNLREFFYPMGLNYHEIEDVGLYTLPLDLNLEFFYYNTDLYKKYNLEVPVTWDEFFANCETLKANGVTPIAITGIDQWPILRYFAMMPFRMVDNDWAKKVVTGQASVTDQYGQAAMEFIQTAGAYFQEGWSTMDYNTTLNLFLGGKAAMHHTGTWDLSAMQDKNLSDDMKGKIDFFKLPTIENSPTTQNQYFGHGGVGVAFAAAKWNKGQEDFLKYLVENYSENALKIGGFIPMTKATLPAGTDDLTVRCWAELPNFETNILTWDVILDETSVVWYGENLTALAMGLITPDEFAEGADQVVKDNLPK